MAQHSSQLKPVFSVEGFDLCDLCAVFTPDEHFLLAPRKQVPKALKIKFFCDADPQVSELELPAAMKTLRVPDVVFGAKSVSCQYKVAIQRDVPRIWKLDAQTGQALTWLQLQDPRTQLKFIAVSQQTVYVEATYPTGPSPQVEQFELSHSLKIQTRHLLDRSAGTVHYLSDSFVRYDGYRLPVPIPGPCLGLQYGLSDCWPLELLPLWYGWQHRDEPLIYCCKTSTRLVFVSEKELLSCDRFTLDRVKPVVFLQGGSSVNVTGLACLQDRVLFLVAGVKIYDVTSLVSFLGPTS